MATSNIETTSETRIWIQACSASEKCEIESLKGDVSFIESEIMPTIQIEENNMYFLENNPRQFIGNGVSKLWVYIDNASKLRKRAIALATSSSITNIEVGSGLVDAFNRLRVSNPTTLFDAQLQYSDQPLLWETKLTGSGTNTHDPLNSATDMSVVADGDRVERQIFEYVRYQAGKSQVVKMTYTPDENLTDVSVEVVLRSSTSGVIVDKVITQQEWNYDKMDGTGISGITLDLTKSQIFFADLEWLSVGTVAYGFMIDRQIRYVHFDHNANKIRGAYMTTANLPLKYNIERNGNEIIQELGYNDYKNGLLIRYKGIGTSATLKEICTEVESEGGVSRELGTLFSPSSGVSPVTLTAGQSMYIAARHSLLFNGVENRGLFIPKSFFVGSSDEKIFSRVIYNPTIVGGTFTPYSEGGHTSIMEFATDIVSISGGLTIKNNFVYASSTNQSINSQGIVEDIVSKLPFGIGIDANNPISLVLEIVNQGAGATDIDFGVDWLEVK